MYNRQAMNQYRQVNAQAAVDSSPYKIITLLMQGALDRMTSAKGCMERSDIEGRNHFINKAVDIIDCLKESLVHKHDEEMTANLENLYDYMSRRLFEANAENNPVKVDEVAGLLGTIFDGWKELEGKLPDAGLSLAPQNQPATALAK